jgi:hypothetical protein
MSARMTPAAVLAAVEAIPETPENYRELREAVRDAKALVEQEKAA